jgi:hypothetical protein
MLKAITESTGVADLFEHLLSTDAVSAFKPSPRVYQMGETAFKLPRENIVFAAAGGWDASGAKAFGYNTFWVNHFNVPVEELTVKPDAIGNTLTDLAKYVIGVTRRSRDRRRADASPRWRNRRPQRVLPPRRGSEPEDVIEGPAASLMRCLFKSGSSGIGPYATTRRSR